MSYVGAYKGPELEHAHNRSVIVYRRSSFNSYWGFVALDITSEVDGKLDARLLAGPFLCTRSLPEGARVARNGGSKSSEAVHVGFSSGYGGLQCPCLYHLDIIREDAIC